MHTNAVIPACVVALTWLANMAPYGGPLGARRTLFVFRCPGFGHEPQCGPWFPASYHFPSLGVGGEALPPGTHSLGWDSFPQAMKDTQDSSQIRTQNADCHPDPTLAHWGAGGPACPGTAIG